VARNPTFAFIAVGLLVWLGSSSLRAQATGAISGVITDESGALIPGVTVEATNVGTNQTRTAVTAGDGRYSIPLLQPGQYSVQGTLQGFKTFVREGVTVTVESTSRLDMKLSVGGREETISVTADAPLVETSNATLGIVVDEKKIVELPLNGRNFTQLGTLLPGVVAPPGSLGGSSGDATPGGFGATTSGFSINGMRNQSNNFLLDGTSNNDTFNSGFVLRPPPDAIQEFKILTHSYGAEYGRNSGAVINVVTKSGSNEFHGGAWEFNRDDALQARNYFAPANQPKPKLKQHQFGASLGGPVARNRLFGFGYYEGFRNTNGATQNFVVLSDAQRTGNFGSTVIRDPLTRLPFAGNTIPADRLDPIAVRLLDEFVPRANSPGNSYIASPDTTDDRDQFGVRFDYHLTPNNTLLGRYMRNQTERIAPRSTGTIANISKAKLQDVMVSNTHVFSPRAINVARFAYNWIDAQPAITSGLTNAAYGINVPNNVAAASGLAQITVTGFFNSLGDASQPFVQRNNDVFQFSDEFMWVRGSHAMKFGFEVRHEHMLISFVNTPNGRYQFTGEQTGHAAADFLLGLPSVFSRATANTDQDGSGVTYSGFAQDEFRPLTNVTLNLGVRYELNMPFEDVNGILNAFRPGVQSQRFPNAPLGLVYPGDPGVPDGTYDADKNNFAPRVGLAWDATGTGRSSLRAAWGIFYDVIPGQGDFFQNGVLAPPFTPVFLAFRPPASLTLADPLSAVTGGADPFPPGVTFIGHAGDPGDFRSSYAHHFNVSWQQQVGDHMGAEIGYVGSRGKNLPVFLSVNPGLVTPGQTTRGVRLFPAFSAVRPTFTVGESWYDSLQASLRMRPTKGLSFLASYTLGHAEDHVSGLNIGPGGSSFEQGVRPVTIGDDASIEHALAAEKGDATFDARHRFVVSFSAELPTPQTMGTLIRHLAGGWQVNGIVQTQTGFPLTVEDSVNTIDYLRNRPNMTCDPNDNAPHTVEEWFSTACFQRRTLAQTGVEESNQPRNVVRGPGFSRTDLSLFKNIDMSRLGRLQLRVEAFNLFNQVRFGQPGSSIGTPSFGRITSAEDGRIIQLAIKYNF
jgi:hypothetical protein